MPTLKQFRYFVAVADALSFRRAAELAHISQPTLSAQLSVLERRLGVQLVERSRSRVMLTPVGKEVVAKARLVLRDVQDIVDLAQHGRDPLAGRVRLGVLPTLGPYMLPLVLPEMHRRYRSLSLYIREGLAEDLAGRLAGGDIDLALTALPVNGSELEIAPLFREPLLLVAGREHPLAAKREVRRRDLSGQKLLALERGHRLHRDVRALAVECGADLLPEYEGTSLDTLRQMVGMGMGLAFLPSLYAYMEARGDRQIAVCRFTDRRPARTVVLAWRRTSPRRAQFSRLADLMRRLVARRIPEVEAFTAKQLQRAED
ncbi:MAG: hydrogen peroxide-inducible genes activator [Dongiaceae bacterium]